MNALLHHFSKSGTYLQFITESNMLPNYYTAKYY